MLIYKFDDYWLINEKGDTKVGLKDLQKKSH